MGRLIEVSLATRGSGVPITPGFTFTDLSFVLEGRRATSTRDVHLRIMLALLDGADLICSVRSTPSSHLAEHWFGSVARRRIAR